MAGHTIWETYPASYRSREMQILATWIAAGESGSVVGLIGSGRSNLLGFLCHRPDVLQTYLPPQGNPVALIPVDLYNLPANDLSTLYRTILHAFYWVRDRFDSSLQQAIIELYMEYRAATDPFLPQRALFDLLLLFQNRHLRVILVMNRFDRFCQTATPHMINTLRSLRDNFKDTLSYLVGMLQEVVYLPDPAALGDMYELLDSRVCWVGAMTRADSAQMLDRVLRTAPAPPTHEEEEAMLRLSGCFPVLLKAIGTWWLTASSRPTEIESWSEVLLAENNITYRLERMWNSLTQEEQLALSEVQKLQVQFKAANNEADETALRRLDKVFQALVQKQRYALNRLDAKGVCHPANAGWWISSELFAGYIATLKGRIRGRIWVDETARIVYQGQETVESLTSLQYEILRYLAANPRIKHTRDDVIDNVWPEEEQREGITPNALQVQIAAIRKRIEPNPAKPRYLITWHGRPGGYQFFPEGKPE